MASLKKQFKNLFEKASRSKGITGEVFLQLCESRLDNLVYRMGIAPQSAARQLVSHEHIVVNGKICNIPSRTIKISEKELESEKNQNLFYQLKIIT